MDESDLNKFKDLDRSEVVRTGYEMQIYVSATPSESALGFYLGQINFFHYNKSYAGSI